ncbi:MAG: IS1 family transposase [Vampirovibrionales bacterium]
MAFYPKKTQKCWVWLAWDRQQKRCVGVELGRRNTETGKRLWKQLNLFEGSTVFTDYLPAYDAIVTGARHVVGKAYTWGVESLNSRIRHYLARFRRKTFCYSKSLEMVKATLTIFFTPHWQRYLC